jgi:hypothetical protein
MSLAVHLALKLDFRGAFAAHPMFWSMPILYLYFLLDARVVKNNFLNVIILVLIAIGFLINWFLKIC